MKNGDGIRRKKSLDRVGNLDPQDAGVRQTRALDFSTSSANTADQALDSKKIPVRILGRDGRQKRSIAATEIDLERGASPENSRQIESLETIRRDELDVACYG